MVMMPARSSRSSTPAPSRSILARITGDSLKTVPKGYPADHPQLDLLRRKQVCVSEKFPDSVVTSARFADLAIESMKSMKPFIDYLNKVALKG